MKKVNNLLFTLLLFSGWIILGGWGATAHRKINQQAPASFPQQMSFMQSTWSSFLADHASDADYRKDTDPSEAPKHYIDIDNYTVFQQQGRIPQTFDSVLSIYGYSFVVGNGILPWSTKTTYDSVKACFQRNNFSKAMSFAADLGHYVGDGHQPLHITTYYDGKTGSQNGIHSRYETHMINDYIDQIAYPNDDAYYINDVQGYIFSYLYDNYKYVDSVLLADDYAQGLAGSHSNTAYYTALWEKTGGFTIDLLRKASLSLASLIYTAWVEAGSPNGIDEPAPLFVHLLQNMPNPVNTTTTIPFTVDRNNTRVSVKIYDEHGALKADLMDSSLSAGSFHVTWNAALAPAGIYYYVLESEGRSGSGKMIVVH
jgi:hypothetical protein